jgi:hypothetical protein
VTIKFRELSDSSCQSKTKWRVGKVYTDIFASIRDKVLRRSSYEHGASDTVFVSMTLDGV